MSGAEKISLMGFNTYLPSARRGKIGRLRDGVQRDFSDTFGPLHLKSPPMSGKMDAPTVLNVPLEAQHGAAGQQEALRRETNESIRGKMGTK